MTSRLITCLTDAKVDIVVCLEQLMTIGTELNNSFIVVTLSQ